MKLVVAVDKEWGIGNRGGLLARVRADLVNFRKLTEGHVVVLGSKTLATFPGGRPLKNRTNIVLSRRKDYSPEGALVADSIEGLLDILKNYDTDDVYVIGGETVYTQMLPYCDTAYVTKFEKSFEKDAIMPDLDASDEWTLSETGEEQTSNPETDSEADLKFRFCTYKRIK